MSLGSKSFPARRGGDQAGGGGRRSGEERGDDGGGRSDDDRRDSKKEPRFDRCFSGLDLRIGPGPLKDMDAGRLKLQIRKWARAVVSYARQISFGGSPRSRPASSSPTSAATLPAPPAKSGLGSAREEQPPTTTT